jgi:hypothetical protein
VPTSIEIQPSKPAARQTICYRVYQRGGVGNASSAST